MLTNILPFSFKEYLQFENKEVIPSEVKEKLSQYVLHGGYPEILSKKVPLKDYLSNLLNAILYEDIVKRYKIRNPQQLGHLAVYLVSNIANEFSYNSLTKIGKIKSSHTIEKYLIS